MPDARDDSPSIKGSGPLLRNRAAPKVVRAIDQLETHGARHILMALAGDNPETLDRMWLNAGMGGFDA